MIRRSGVSTASSRLKEIVKKAKNSVSDWTEASRAGRKYLEEILEDKKEESQYSDSLQQKCDRLRQVVRRLESHCSQLDQTLDKLRALVELEESPLYLLKAVETTFECLTEQTKLDRLVLEQLPLLTKKEVEDEVAAVFFSASWVHEPYLDQKFLCAERILEEFVKA